MVTSRRNKDTVKASWGGMQVPSATSVCRGMNVGDQSATTLHHKNTDLLMYTLKKRGVRYTSRLRTEKIMVKCGRVQPLVQYPSRLCVQKMFVKKAICLDTRRASGSMQLFGRLTALLNTNTNTIEVRPANGTDTKQIVCHAMDHR